MAASRKKQKNKATGWSSWSAAGFAVGFACGFTVLGGGVWGVLMGIGLAIVMGVAGKSYPNGK